MEDEMTDTRYWVIFEDGRVCNVEAANETEARESAIAATKGISAFPNDVPPVAKVEIFDVSAVHPAHR
jgi:hypothetical protein